MVYYNIAMNHLRTLLAPSNIEVIIFHSPCVDGYSAACVSFLMLGQSVKFVPVSAGGKLDDYTNILGKNVLMVDVVTSDYEHINAIAKKLIILDHHITNKEPLSACEYAYIDTSKSGVGLAWEYFYPDTKMPRCLQYIQDRDLWAWNIPESRIFCDGLYELLDITDYEFVQLTNLIKDNTGDVFTKYYNLGTSLIEIKNKTIKSITNNSKFYKTILDNEYTICIYNAMGNIVSDLGNYVITNFACDFVIIWNYNHGDQQYRYSLRSNDAKADVGVIAKMFEGGGHRNASGLTSKLHPNELFGLVEKNI